MAFGSINPGPEVRQNTAVRACEEECSPRGIQEVERNEGTTWCTLPSSLQADLLLKQYRQPETMCSALEPDEATSCSNHVRQVSRLGCTGL